MNILRKLLATAAAVVVAMASGMLVAQADSTPTVYNTPGGQISAGRLWNTTCANYSSSVVRCRADIWATSVKYEGGRYVAVTGWTFNNLTYLPSTRASWAGNNLGRTNDQWDSDGRTWRTECDTPATGRGGCRTYIWATTMSVDNGRFVASNGWLFNNIVLFSSGSVQNVTEIPPWIIDQSRLDVTGLVSTPIRLGVPMKDLEKLGYYSIKPTDGAGPAWMPDAKLESRGFWQDQWMGDELEHVSITTPHFQTVDGARVGMTVGQVKAIYGPRIRMEKKYQQVTGNWHTMVVERGGNELMFLAGTEGQVLFRPLVDSDVITSITAKKYSKTFPYRP